MRENEKDLISVSVQTLKRLPFYLNYLKSLDNDTQNISSPSIARELDLNEVQVRKDLAAVSTKAGKPKKGFAVEELICDIESFLGYNNVNEAVLVGAGHLGRALLSYKGFQGYGLKLVAAFDKNKELIGTEIAEKRVFPLDKLQNLCLRLNVKIGIITVPAQEAQKVCDLLVDSGILAIWNFAPIHLNVPKNILVQNENIASSFAILSKHLSDQIKTTK